MSSHNRHTSAPIPAPEPSQYRVDVFSRERTERRLGALHAALEFFAVRAEHPDEGALLGTAERFDRWLAEVDR